jgi:hypothetical protein
MRAFLAQAWCLIPVDLGQIDGANAVLVHITDRCMRVKYRVKRCCAPIEPGLAQVSAFEMRSIEFGALQARDRVETRRV